MKRKLVATTLAGFFGFILITTAWDYCAPARHVDGQAGLVAVATEAGRPDPDTLLLRGDSLSHGHQIKKPHHPCASIKDAYDVFAAFKVRNGNIQHDFKDIISDFSVGPFEASSSDFHGLSPPFGDSPFHDLPIFLLYRNLRL